MTEKNNSKRIDKKDLIKTITILEKFHDDLMLLQEAYMKEQQAMYHEKWKVRHLTRILRRVAPHEALSEEELDKQLRGKEN